MVCKLNCPEVDVCYKKAQGQSLSQTATKTKVRHCQWERRAGKPKVALVGTWEGTNERGLMRRWIDLHYLLNYSEWIYEFKKKNWRRNCYLEPRCPLLAKRNAGVSLDTKFSIDLRPAAFKVFLQRINNCVSSHPLSSVLAPLAYISSAPSSMRTA